MTFVRAANSADVPEGATLAVHLDGQEIAIVRGAGALYATSNRCTHAGSRLDGGKVTAEWIACPLHGARFRLSTGECINVRLGYAPLATYVVREAGGIIEIDLAG